MEDFCEEKNKKTITIITPTYNRRENISKLYESLKSQTVKDFTWLVIDDGSADKTEEFFNNLLASFSFEYHKKTNGGKHTALNYSHQFIDTPLTCIVDSDDWLVPNAVETIVNDWTEYRNMENVAGLTYLKRQTNGEYASPGFPKEIEKSNVIDFRINKKIKGDCFEVVTKEVFTSKQFPIYKSEKYVPEGYLWNYIGSLYDTVYINKTLYICEYLEDGLTRSGRTLRLKSPKGCLEHCLSYFEANEKRKIRFDVLLKQAILCGAYTRFAGVSRKEILNRCNSNYIRFTYVISLMLYLIWKQKYM